MSLFFSPQPFLHPELGMEVQLFIRVAYGVLLCATLLLALPHWRRFFISERWGGYSQSVADVDVIQNPFVFPLVMTLWIACGILIAKGQWTPWPAVLNLLLCRYFFIGMRWKGLLRGMGAPGFVLYWGGLSVALLEYCLKYAPEMRSFALQVLQIDFAFIYLSSGFYKFSAGYRKNQGMELGMVNPAWGYWWQAYKEMPPAHFLFRFLNHLAWASQIVAGFLMMLPPTRFVGGSIIIGMFIFIATQIRLGLLCEVVVFCSGVIFFHPGSAGDQLIAAVVGPVQAPYAEPFSGQPIINAILGFMMGAYLLLLPVVHGGLSYNFYLRRSFPGPLQKVLERYSNFFGLIVWRVFSVDLINFFIRIYRCRPAQNETREPISTYEWGHSFRFLHVAESITLACVFTTLKYYPSNSALFNERLLRYARTIQCEQGDQLIFEYVSLKKEVNGFVFVPVAEYWVDPVAGNVVEQVLDPSVSVRSPHAVSPVHEGARPGTYAPLGGR